MLRTADCAGQQFGRWNADTAPACCHVVPTLWRGNFDTAEIMRVMGALLAGGSVAAPGFMKPEGVVIFHTQSGAMFKKTYEKDDAGKGREPEATIKPADPNFVPYHSGMTLHPGQSTSVTE